LVWYIHCPRETTVLRKILENFCNSMRKGWSEYRGKKTIEWGRESTEFGGNL